MNISGQAYDAERCDRAAARDLPGGLGAFCALFAPRFSRVEPRRRMSSYVYGLMGGAGRKNGWTLAEAAGEAGPEGMQRLLNEASWDEDGVRDDTREVVVQAIGDVWQGRLIIGDYCFSKRGSRSAGAAPRVVEETGRTGNAQIGIFLAYASEAGVCLIDRELYLPREWTDHRDRCRAAGIDDSVKYESPEELARVMIDRALDAGVPFVWVTAALTYGRSEYLRRSLEERGVPHIVEVPGDCRVTTTNLQVRNVDSVIGQLSETVWHRLSHGDSATGHLVRDWAAVDLHRFGRRHGSWLLAGRSITDPSEITYHLCFGPVGAILSELARTADGHRAVEGCLRAARRRSGLADYQVRGYRAWYRHISLSMVAAAYLAILEVRTTVRDSDELPLVKPVRSRPNAVAPWW